MSKHPSTKWINSIETIIVSYLFNHLLSDAKVENYLTSMTTPLKTIEIRWIIMFNLETYWVPILSSFLQVHSQSHSIELFNTRMEKAVKEAIVVQLWSPLPQHKTLVIHSMKDFKRVEALPQVSSSVRKNTHPLLLD